MTRKMKVSTNTIHVIRENAEMIRGEVMSVLYHGDNVRDILSDKRVNHEDAIMVIAYLRGFIAGKREAEK